MARESSANQHLRRVLSRLSAAVGSPVHAAMILGPAMEPAGQRTWIAFRGVLAPGALAEVLLEAGSQEKLVAAGEGFLAGHTAAQKRPGLRVRSSGQGADVDREPSTRGLPGAQAPSRLQTFPVSPAGPQA